MATHTNVDIPHKQKAWVVVSRGTPKQAVVLNEQTDVPSKLKPGEVLIKVQAAALNPVGYKLMALAPNLFIKRPHVAEHDFAGIVVDANDSKYHNGQEVYGYVPVPVTLKTRQGALAQYLRCPAGLVHPRPSFMKPTEAAGLALVGMTAYQLLYKMIKIEPGQSIFINGGSTAVGITAIQMAKAIGCTVTASGSTQREELFKSLGVDRFIDYTKAPVYQQLTDNPPSPKFHAIVEAVGNTDVPLYTHSESYLAPNGLFISVGPYPRGASGILQLMHLLFEANRPRVLGGVNRKWVLATDQPLNEFDNFGKLVDDGKVKMIVDSVYAFDDVYSAYDRIMSQRAAGKVVVKIDPDVE